MNTPWRTLFSAVLIGLMLTGCVRPIDRPAQVRVWELDDPTGLHPFVSKDAPAYLAMSMVFQKLMNYSHETYELLPVLAAKRPELERVEEGGLILHFELRQEARWDDSSPITGHDVAFSFKAAIHPLVRSEHLKPYLSFVDSIAVDQENPKHFSVFCNAQHMRAEVSIGVETFIIPKHVYDPDGLLDRATIRQLREDIEFRKLPEIEQFAIAFQDIGFLRDPAKINGSGGYRLAEWQTAQRLILERKADWWADDVKDSQNEYLEANPERVVIEIINDQTAALTTLKAGRLDVLRAVKPREFREEMLARENMRERFHLEHPAQFSYSCFGINMRHPILGDKQIRQAMAHLVNYDRMIEEVMYGFSQRITGPVMPFMKLWHNPALKPRTFDPNKAKTLLAEAGWADSNNDGILDRMVNGKRQDFRFTFMLNAGNREREMVALIYQQDLEQAGIQMDIQTFDWGIYLDKLTAHDFDMFYIVLSSEPGLEDFSQLWHTESANGGSNFVWFGNADTDRLIETINSTLDEQERVAHVHRFLETLYEEVPYIFLWSSENKIAISKAFDNTNISAIRPGFWVPGFRNAK